MAHPQPAGGSRLALKVLSTSVVSVARGFPSSVSCGWCPRYLLRHLREGLTHPHWDTPAWPLRVTSVTPQEGLFFRVFAA